MLCSRWSDPAGADNHTPTPLAGCPALPGMLYSPHADAAAKSSRSSPADVRFPACSVLHWAIALPIRRAPFGKSGWKIGTPDIRDRKSVVSGKGVSVRVDLGGSRIFKKTK